ncbi:MAG TPA: DinB family protein [Gemmatimonadales bacterium]
MHRELQEMLEQIEKVKAEGRALVAGLSHEQFNWRPAPNRWSVGECLDHLNTIRKVFPAIDHTIDEAERRGLKSVGPFRYGWWSRLVVRSMEPPPWFRMRTFPMLFPASTPLAPSEVLRDFLELRDQLGQRIRRADGLDLKRAVVQSPVSRFVRLPLGAYFAFLLAHDRRHLWQARQVIATPGFPGGTGAGAGA